MALSVAPTRIFSPWSRRPWSAAALECGREAAAFIKMGDNSRTPLFASKCHGRLGRAHGRNAPATQRNSAQPTNILSRPRSWLASRCHGGLGRAHGRDAPATRWRKSL